MTKSEKTITNENIASVGGENIKARATLRQAIAGDQPSIMKIFREVTDQMLAAGIDQWNHDYPDTDTIKRDIDEGNCYVVNIADEVVGSVAIDKAQDPQYKSVHWPSRGRNAYVIHRLGVLPSYQGYGLGKQLCQYCEHLAGSSGATCIRLDAYAGNPYSNKLYHDLGYVRANGLCYFRKKAIPFYCYEKTLA